MGQISRMSAQPISKFGESRVAARFAAAMLVLGMLSWPIALLPPPFAGHSFYLYLPARVLLLGIALALLARTRFSMPCWLRWSALVFAVGMLGQFSLARWSSGAIAETLAYAVIPLAVAVCAAASRPQRLARWLAAVWVLEVAYAALNLHYGNEAIGSTGNRNWLAILVASLAPWAFIIFRQRSGILAGLLVVAIPSVWVLKHCRSRAAWLALGLYAAVMLVQRARGKRRVAMLAIFAILLVLAIPLAGSLTQGDIRIPTWKAAIQMAVDAPLTGTGLGQYAITCVPYQLATDYHDSRDAADVTEHPHNEFLHLAAAAGFPVAIAWLVLLLPLLRTPQHAPAWQRAAQCSGILLAIHGMLDKPLVQPPTDVLMLAALGLCWAPLIRVRSLRAELPDSWRLVYLAGATAVMLLAIAESARTFALTWHKRAAIVLRHDMLDARGAFSAYRAMLAIDGDHLGALYGASSVLVNQLQDPDTALDYLHAARAIAPDYAHLNGLTGRALGARGQHSDALPYLRRECELYPSQLRRLQELWLGQVLAGDIASLPETQDAIRALCKKRAAMWERGEAFAALRDWEHGLENDAEFAIAAAYRLCTLENRVSKSRANLRAIDPLIDGVQMSGERIDGGFDHSDVAYWRLSKVDPLKALRHHLEQPEVDIEAWLLNGLKSCQPIAYLRGEAMTLWLKNRYWQIGADRQLISLNSPPPGFADSATVILAPNAVLLRNQILGVITDSTMDWFPSERLAHFNPANFRFIEP
ncbi:MAG: O-antigen ligase [Rhodothermales bacterium]|jgi:O-antigen ligase